MTKIYRIDELDKEYIIDAIKSNKIIVYPTDTIYGIGCNALDDGAVIKIREIKKRDIKPFSVIAPNKRWIISNFMIHNKHYIEKLPGPFTFLLKYRKECPISKYVSPGSKVIGVRIPKNEFYSLIEESNVPFVTTSVNYTGQKHISSIDEIPKLMLRNIDIIIDAGPLNNPPSTIFDLTSEIPKIIKRK